MRLYVCTRMTEEDVVYFKYKECTKMIAHLDAFNQLVADLLNLDEEIKDEDKVLILLNSLPDSYAHLTTTLLHGKVTISFEEVSNPLMNYEIRHADKQMNSSTSEALVVRGRKERNECAFCHEIGHWKKDGPKLKNKNKGTQANVTYGEDEYGSEFVLAVTSNSFSNVWLMDTAASQHMCPNKEWFSSLDLKCHGVVLVGDDYSLEKEGVGTMKFKHHDGVTREFSNVWYVPKLKKNLISLGVLESGGHNYSSSNGIMKVKRGALVEMKAIREHNMYVLQHLRLGHAGESALQGLAKQGLKSDRKKIKVLRTDNGGEYTSDPFNEVCKKEGIVRHLTVPRSPQQNGVVERLNRTLLEKVRCVKEYRLWCPELKKLVISKDVTFNEMKVLKVKNHDADDEHEVRAVQQVEFERQKLNFQQQENSNPQVSQVRVEEYRNDNEDVVLGEESEGVETDDEENVEPSYLIAKRRERRIIRKPTRYMDCVSFAFPVVNSEIPSKFREASESPENKEWKHAMNEEMDSLIKNKTWNLVSLPEGKRAIGCKWVFAKKEVYKARLVAKGYAQKEGVDYNEIFSPVAKQYSIRVMLALVAQFDLELVQLDVKTAFLHGDLYEEIYMFQPDGYKVKGKENLKQYYGKKNFVARYVVSDFAGDLDKCRSTAVIERKKIALKKVPTEENPADMLTKVVGLAKFEHYKDLANIISV
ncbi:hypothetical protein LXL04_016853 [Taraxacum kok-saghyz]